MNDNKNQANNESEIKAKINFNTEKKVIYISVLLVCLLLLKESFFERGYDIFFSIKYIFFSIIAPFLAIIILALYCRKDIFTKIIHKTNVCFIIIIALLIFSFMIILQFNIYTGSDVFIKIINSMLSFHTIFILIFINLTLLISNKIPEKLFSILKSKDIKNIYLLYIFLILIGLFIPLISKNIFNNRFFMLS